MIKIVMMWMWMKMRMLWMMRKMEDDSNDEIDKSVGV